MFWRTVVVRLGYCIASLLILAAFSVSLSNLLTPFLNHHRVYFEKLATSLLDRPVKIGEINIGWHFVEPEIYFHHVSVLDPASQAVNLEVPLIKIDVAIFNSLFARTFIMDSLEVNGVSFALHQNKAGEVSVDGFDQLLLTDKLSGHSLSPNAVLAWIFSQPRLILSDFHVQYFSNDGTEKNITLKMLELSNTTRTHELSGNAVLNQPIPTRVAIHFNWKGNITDLPHVSADLSLDLKNISLAQWVTKNAWHGLHAEKGVGNATVEAKWNDNAWQAVQSQFRFRDAVILLDQVFDNTLTFDEIAGSLEGQKNAAGEWVFSTRDAKATNDDLSAQAKLSLTIPLNDSPLLDLQGDFTLFHANNVSRYLPLKIYDADLNKWLRGAFLGGQVINGYAVVQGRLKDFPFDNGAGKFAIGGNVKNVAMRYAPDWPLMKNINGKLLFSGRSMTADVTSAKILDIPLQNIHADIPDLGTNPVLTAKSTVQADLSQGLNFIQKSPLQHTIGESLQALELSGPMQLALNLSVPLNHPDDTTVTGDTTITNAILNLPEWNLAINPLSGAFRFTENSIVASNMTGQLLGHPVTLDLQTEQQKNKSAQVKATLQGAIAIGDLKTWLNLPIDEILQGTTQYKTELFLAPPHDSAQPTHIVFHSDLQGVAISLPGSYGKKSQDSADFQADFFVQENQPVKTRMGYKKLVSTGVVLQHKSGKLKLLSADVHLGSGDASWQTQPGIILTGNIDHLDVDTLLPYLSRFTEKAQPHSGGVDADIIDPNLFRGVDIHVKTATYSGYELNNLGVQLTKTADNFLLGLNNSDMDGQIIFSRKGLSRGVQAKFQRLNLSTNIASGKQNPVDPRHLPPISFVGDNVRFGDMNLGHAVLDLVPDSSGMTVKQMELSSASYTLRATGNWTNSRSRLQGNLMTTNVTELLKSWGFASSNLMGTNGSVDFDLNWPGGFFHPSVQGLSGHVSLNLGEGHIINLSNGTDAKIGLGRLLNIFSLQSLPRRLSLNFNDLSEKGYSFDSLKGDFVLQNGNAMTQKTRFRGPVAMIEISGRIGLAAKDLDMNLSVTPHVTGSLPVVAAIATANPIAGVATWVVEKMVNPAVSQMTTYDYAITGSWANPVWTQIKSVGGSTVTAPASGAGGSASGGSGSAGVGPVRVNSGSTGR